MKEYKIFVSANQKELKNERLAVKETILGNATLRDFFDVFLFEDVPAKEKSPSSVYLKAVDKSDVYLGILGYEYGKKEKDGLSTTQREYKSFIKSKNKRDTLIFIKGESRNDSKRDKDIQRFIRKIKKPHIYDRFVTTEELKTKVLNALISFLDDKGVLSKLPFDQSICKDAEYKDINEKEVKEFLENRAVKLKVEIPKISIKDFLVNTLKIVNKEDNRLKPINTALLFFGKNPSEYIPQHQIRIVRFRGTTRIEPLDSQEIKEPIYKMLDAVELFFKRNTRLASKIVEFKRVEIPEYPYEAIREAIINAIAHRDYNRQGAPIIISIFDDRVEISSPGGLLPGLNIKNLEGHHETRNQKICGIFYETKDMEKFGTGIGKMKRLMKEHLLREPDFAEEGNFFCGEILWSTG